jgi:hypothetical protein
MSDSVIRNNEKGARPKGGNFIYALIQLIHVITDIFLPESLMSQHIISVLQSVDSSCIVIPVQKVIIIH